MTGEENISAIAEEIVDDGGLLSEYEITFNVVSIILIILSVVGNSLVLLRLLRDSRLRKDQMLFLNLAVVDILDTLNHILYWLVLFWVGHHWTAGDIFCRIFTTFQVHVKACSIFLLVAMAVDMYLPLYGSTNGGSQATYLAMGSWLAALIPALPHLILAGEIQLSLKGICFCTVNRYIEHSISFIWAYFVIYYTLMFVIPVFVGTVLYSRTVLTVNPWSYSRISTNQVTRNLSLTLFVVFVVISLPHIFARLLLVFSYFRIYSSKVDTYLSLLYLSKGSINPFIYLAFQSKVPCWRRPATLDLIPQVTWTANSTATIRSSRESSEVNVPELKRNSF